MDQMKVVDIFKSQTGGYKWGQRDCMSTLCLLYQNLCTKIDPLNIEIFERLRQESEKKAWAYCIKNGGPQVFYFLRAGNGAKKVKNHSLTNPGDVLFYDKPIEVGIGAWIKGKPGAEAMGFVDAGFQHLHWTKSGLRQIQDSSPCAVMRFI